MTKKEQFLAFVMVGAITQDYRTQSNDMPLMLRLAASIPEANLPDDPWEAADIFLAFCNGTITQPHKWMLRSN